MLLARRIAAALALATALLAPLAIAAPIYFDATLTGASENPPNASLGTGFATVIFDPVAHTMEVSASFSGLTGTTTASHIHCCVTPPGNVGVATPLPSFPGFPSGVTSGTYSSLFDLTLASSFNPAFVTANGGTPAGAEAALLTGLLAGRAYWNIHTSFVPSGEIRGFLTQRVPEPATLALVLAGLAAIAWSSRQRAAAQRR